MESFKRFRLMAVRGSLALLGVVSVIVFYFNSVVAQGLLLGGLAGIIAFWIVALRSEKLAAAGANPLDSFSFRWTLVRMTLYALALGRAYFLDQETLRGLMAAVGGLFIIRVVLVFLAFTGWDLKPDQKN